MAALLQRFRLRSLRPLRFPAARSHRPARCFQVNAAKKAKDAGDEASQARALSAEQQERIRKNKEAARQLLAQRNVPPGFGESWRRQLAGEFSKPYFVEVSSVPRSPRLTRAAAEPPLSPRCPRSSWRSWPRRGSATRCIRPPSRSSPGRRCATSGM